MAGVDRDARQEAGCVGDEALIRGGAVEVGAPDRVRTIDPVDVAGVDRDVVKAFAAGVNEGGRSTPVPLRLARPIVSALAVFQVVQ